MALFGCRGCEGRDQEIRHLVAENERLHKLLDKAQGRICELASPGIETRLEPEKRKVRELPRPKREPDRYGFPGYDSLPTKTGDKVEVS